MELRDKIYGCLVGAAIGEAMGAATETWSSEMILKAYGDYVSKIMRPPTSTHAKGLSAAGQMTGGFSFVWMMLEAVLSSDGKMDPAMGKKVLLDWASHPAYYQFAGTATRRSVQLFRGEQVDDPHPFLTCNHHNATNEAATRAAAIAVFYPGNPDAAVGQMVEAYREMHNNTVALSGCGAITAAIAASLAPCANVSDILQHSVRGANRGLEIAESFNVRPAACASVARRIQLAIALGTAQQSCFVQAMKDIEECVGTGLAANEAVAAAIGCVSANGGDPLNAIKMAVNIGNDTDAIATMTGAIVGALNGYQAFDPAEIALVEAVNGYDFARMADRICAVL